MGVEIVIDTDEPSIGRSQNDWLQYSQRAGSDSDSEPSIFDEDDPWEAWEAKLSDPDHPLTRGMVIAMGVKDRFQSVLTKAGVRKSKMHVDSESGKCSACDSMGGLYSSFAKIEIGAVAGCPSCNILVKAIEKYVPEADRGALTSPSLGIMEEWNSGCAGRQFIRTKNVSADQSGAMGIVAILDGNLEMKNFFTKTKEISSEVVMELNFFGVKDDPASWDRIGLARHISGDTSSDAAFRWFQEQLDRCTREHSLCKMSFNGGQLPRRVLDLGPPAGGVPGQDADVRIVESNGARDSYVCLSYCWGGTIDIRLTKARYEDYTSNIAWDTLPQGYRDAIHLTRKLGVRYIWIDSVCIIQDDDDDWREQASQMASIYQGALVTLAATKAKSPSDGYFSVSPPEYHASRLYHRDARGKVRHAYARRTIPHFFSSTATGEPNYSLDRSPLLRRGWVFQERVLSPRILHLGAVELAWECNESCACECMGETQTYASEPRWAHTKGSLARNLAAAEGEGDVQPEWRSIVEKYTRTLLTFDKDMFPAISGVVKSMQKHRTDRYLAGLWEASILDDLAWQATDSTVPRPKTWLAPTWSWASVASPVSYLNYRTILSDEYVRRAEPATQRTVLIEASVTPAGPDPTAEICQGQLVLFGPMLAARLEWPTEPNEERHFYYAKHDTKTIMFKADYDLMASGPSNVSLGSTVYVLYLCREPEMKRPKGADAKTRVFSLVLRRVDESDGRDNLVKVPGDGTYERIGMVLESLPSPDEKGYVEENGLECVVKLL
jgi:hypothetical protein